MFAHEGCSPLWCHDTVHCVLVPDADVVQVELRNAGGRPFLRKAAANRQDALNEAEYLRLLFRAGGHRLRPGGLKPFALVVDDDVEGCERVVEVLKVSGMRAFGCRSGAEAVSVARETEPDLIVIDDAPSEAGSEIVCRVLRDDEALQVIPIIVIAGADGPSTDPNLVDAVLAKPCQPAILAAAAQLFVRHLSPPIPR